MKPEKEKWIVVLIHSWVWGSSLILIKKSLEHFTPYQVGALRVLISGILLAPIAILNRAKFPRKSLKWLIIAALAGNFIPMFLFPIAETKVSSSIAGIMNSMMPIFTIIVGALFWKTKTTSRPVSYTHLDVYKRQQVPSPIASMVPGSLLFSPMNCATKLFSGRSYRSDGVANCWIRPSLNTATRSDIVSACLLYTSRCV